MGIYIDNDKATKPDVCEYCRFFGSSGGFDCRGERWLNGCFCRALGAVGRNIGPSVGGRKFCVKVGGGWLNPKCPVVEVELEFEDAEEEE